MFKQFKINKDLPTPAYLQLKTNILAAIDTAEIKIDTALPSERELANYLGLSRMTVRRAFDELVNEHYLERRQGSGTYILPKPVEQTMDRVLGFSDEAKNLGFKAGSELIETKIQTVSSYIAKKLKIEENREILKIQRLRTADGEPLAIQSSYLAPRLKDLSLKLLAKNGSLYKTLKEQFDILPIAAKQTVAARITTPWEAKLLNISNDSPVLELERITLDKNNYPFEYVYNAYRGDRYKLLLELKAP